MSTSKATTLKNLISFSYALRDLRAYQAVKSFTLESHAI
jgi:hypothetical protein